MSRCVEYEYSCHNSTSVRLVKTIVFLFGRAEAMLANHWHFLSESLPWGVITKGVSLCFALAVTCAVAIGTQGCGGGGFRESSGSHHPHNDRVFCSLFLLRALQAPFANALPSDFHVIVPQQICHLPVLQTYVFLSVLLAADCCEVARGLFTVDAFCDCLCDQLRC